MKAKSQSDLLRGTRLARNSVDGGQIIYSIDINKIVSLRFPTFWFEPTPQGLFMLQVAFGQSKYYSDNLSENVKRGIRQKLRRGEWPGLAPFGYVNNPKTRTIEPEPTKSRCVTKAFEEFSQGRHTLESLGQRLSFWGVVSGTGKPICKATLQRMLTNKVYLGIIVHNGESYEGGFPAIVSRATFEAVQKVLKQRARPRKSKKRHNFPICGTFNLWRVWRSNNSAICPRTRRNLSLLSLHEKTGQMFTKIFARGFAR